MRTSEQLSVCIPRIEMNIPREIIYEKLQNICVIEQLTEIPLKNESTHKRVLMRIRLNRDNNKAVDMEQKLLETGNVKIVYDMPWYWKMFLNRN
jgi:hypothetical protein